MKAIFKTLSTPGTKRLAVLATAGFLVISGIYAWWRPHEWPEYLQSIGLYAMVTVVCFAANHIKNLNRKLGATRRQA